MAKRRTPPLFEVLSGPARRSGPGGIGPRVPIEVRMPGSGGGAEYGGATGSPASGGAAGTRQWNPIGIICVIVAVVLVAFFGLWFVAYQMGQSKAQALQKAQINNYLDTMAPAPATVIPNVPKPTPAPTGNGVSVSTTPEGQPAIDMGSAPTAGSATDPRRSGNNYLHIVTLSWKDAERAVAFLEKNGVLAAAVPSGAARAVDPSEARAKNLPHLVFALEAIPSDQYRTTERKRQELVEKVRRIGKKWQSEEKGPSDFGEPGWAKFK